MSLIFKSIGELEARHQTIKNIDRTTDHLNCRIRVVNRKEIQHRNRSDMSERRNRSSSRSINGRVVGNVFFNSKAF